MIAIDVMGGDFAPGAVLAGALEAARSGQPVGLFGPRELIEAFLEEHCANVAELPISIFDARETVEMGEEPVAAVKRKRDASLVRAVQAVADGEAEGVLSAGNSGALMVAAMLLLGREEGVERTPLAGFVPALSGPVVGLDLGANTDCKAQHLLQFAHLGARYAQLMLDCSQPRVGILSNGEEDKKGSMVTKEAFQLLKESGLRFLGNIEPHDVFLNKVDVIVCDGFVGNVFLKTMEATYSAMGKVFAKIVGDVSQKIGDPVGQTLAKFVMQELRGHAQQLNQGGAVVLGVKKPAMVCHGSAQAEDIVKAIKNVARYVQVMRRQGGREREEAVRLS